MKKIVCFFAFALLLIGCSGSSNESNAESTDAILGKWKLVSQTYNDHPVVLNDCALGNQFEFKASGARFSAVRNTYDATALTCLPEAIEGRWAKSDNTYYMTYGTAFSILWSNVTISGNTMNTTLTEGPDVTVSTWQKQ